MNRKVEILAPAGSYDGMKAAIAGGCDAVYLGGKSFGARAFADNLEEERMLTAIDYVHLHEKKLYLTVNTLLKNKEIEERLYQYLLPYYEQGLDAVIVQDIGVMAFIHKYFPALPIHASTQMTLTSEKGTEWLKELGVNRFVTARELSLDEIRKIRQKTDMEIESFVHGALCYCYSGQCFMSSFLGGRSGNRGKCAQPCRKSYECHQKDEKVSDKTRRYLLSPKDMCTIEMIPDLVDAGIDSFKIEGRMKRPEYAAYTAYLYRKYTDLYLNLGRKEYIAYLEKHGNEWNQNRLELMDLYNRGGFTKGYYVEYNGKDMMSLERPNHSGVCVGTVTNTQNHTVRFRLQKALKAQDVLEFRGKDGKSIYEYTLKSDLDGTFAEAKTGHRTVIPNGTKVYRTRSNKLLNFIQEDIIKAERKYPIQGYFHANENQHMKFTLVWEDCTITVEHGMAEQAKNQPITKDKVKKQLSRIGDTMFYFESLDVQLNGTLFIPIGKLNEIRRMAVDALEKEKLFPYRRSKEIEYHEKKEKERHQKEEVRENTLCKWQTERKLAEKGTAKKTELVISVCTYAQFQAVMQVEDIHTIYISMALENDKTILQMLDEMQKKERNAYLLLPTILRRNEYEIYEKAAFSFNEEKDLKNISQKGKMADYNQKVSILSEILSHRNVKGYIIKNYEEAALFCQVVKEKFPQKELILDYNMYTWNQYAKDFFAEKGIVRTTVPVELEYELWKERDCRQEDIIVYGHIPLMTSAQCVVKNTKECQKKPEIYQLKDEQRRNFYVQNCCKYCYNLIETGEPLSLHGQIQEIKKLQPCRLRMDFTIEKPDVIRDRVETMVCFLKGKRKNEKGISYGYILGHYKKGVL